MIHTAEALIDEQGNIQLLEPRPLPAQRRAFVIVLPEPSMASTADLPTTGLPLGGDWYLDDEDAAWHYLQGTQ